METKEEKNEKGLLPEVAVDIHTPEFIELRDRTLEDLLQFNMSGDKALLQQAFGQSLDEVTIFPPFHCNVGGDRVRFGRRIMINFDCIFQSAGGIEIGDDVLIGSGVKIYTPNHPIDPEERTTGKVIYNPVKIGNKAWIGGRAIILPGVEIGEGATIGAGSVVTRSVPPRCVVVGNPARIIKRL